jgi:UBX domain-containing protein 7
LTAITRPSSNQPFLPIIMDEAIAMVVTVCSTSTELAAQYVQLADGDPNQAIQLFFENGGVDLAGTTSQPPPSAAPAPVGNATNPIDLDAEGNISDDNDPEITGFQKTAARPVEHYEDDEAMARRLQNEMYGEGANEEDVRAPIARQAETLVGGYGSDLPAMAGPTYTSAVEERMRAIERRRQQC